MGWRIGIFNPCNVGVLLVEDFGVTRDFSHWCVCKGSGVEWCSGLAPTGVTVVGMS